MQEKVGLFLKNNIENIIVIVVSLAYVLYGVLTIEETGKTVAEILAAGALNFIFGLTIKDLRRKSGIRNGLTSETFILKKNAYGDKKLEIAPFIEEIDGFCSYENKNRLIQKQNEILIANCMSYNKFIDGFYDNNKKYKKALKKVKSAKVYKYTPTMMTNAYDNTDDEAKLLKLSSKKFEAKKTASSILGTLICALIFGYFTPGKHLDWNGILWNLIQVVIFIINGQIAYLSAYSFVTVDLKSKIERVINILDRFINLRRNNPDIFKDFEVDK